MPAGCGLSGYRVRRCALVNPLPKGNPEKPYPGEYSTAGPDFSPLTTLPLFGGDDEV